MSRLVSTMPPTPVSCHRYTKGESDFLQRWMNYSQFFVVGIIQSCPLVLLMWLPLYRLVVGIQVGAIQTVIILNQACSQGKTPISITPTDRPAGSEHKEASGIAFAASLKLASCLPGHRQRHEIWARTNSPPCSPPEDPAGVSPTRWHPGVPTCPPPKYPGPVGCPGWQQGFACRGY